MAIWADKKRHPGLSDNRNVFKEKLPLLKQEVSRATGSENTAGAVGAQVHHVNRTSPATSKILNDSCMLYKDSSAVRLSVVFSHVAKSVKIFYLYFNHLQ